MVLKIYFVNFHILVLNEVTLVPCKKIIQIVNVFVINKNTWYLVSKYVNLETYETLNLILKDP